MRSIIVLVLLVFGFGYTKAQIVYTDVNADSVIKRSYNFDLNKDGITDFVINDSTWEATSAYCGGLMNNNISVTPLNENAVLCDSNHFPFPFQANEMIDTSSFSLSWSALAYQHLQEKNLKCVPYLSRTCGCTLYHLDSSYIGAWLNGLEAYVGLKLIKNGNTYSGWVRLSFSHDHVTIKDYAYNSSPGQPILARQGGNILPAVIPAIQWEKSLAGPDGKDNSQNGRSLIQSVQQTADGGYIVSGAIELDSADGHATGWHQGVDNNGFLTRDYWIVKLDNIGNVVWQKALGGTGDDYAMSVQQTTDGGYIVAGYTTSDNGDVTGLHQGVGEDGMPAGDYWIVKLNSAGNLIWQKSLGGSGDDYAASIQQIAGGGFIVAGTSTSNDGDVTGAHQGPGFYNAPPNDDYWIVKLDNNGNITWQKCLGGSNGDEASSIRQTTDGGYIVAGSSGSYDGDVSGGGVSSRYWVVKITGTGNISWEETLGGVFNSDAQSIRQTTDGGYIVAGSAISTTGDFPGNFGGGDYLVIKLDNAGNISWQKYLGGAGTDIAESIQQTADGGYIVTGLTSSDNVEVAGNHSNDYDYWIVKLDIDGNISWRKSLGGSGDDEAKSIQQTADGGYILAGFSNSHDGDVTGNHGSYDMWIVKLGENTVLPLRLFSFTGIIKDNATKLTWQTTNDINTVNFIVERSDNAINFSSIGKVTTQDISTNTNSYKYTDAAPLQGMNYYRLKMEDKDGKFTYSFVIKINYTGSNQISIAPNPVLNSTTIFFSLSESQKVSIDIYDIQGRLVKILTGEQMQPGAHELVWNKLDEKGKIINAGIYFLKMQTENYTEIKKIVVVQ